MENQMIYGQPWSAPAIPEDIPHGDIGVFLGRSIRNSLLLKEVAQIRGAETIRATVVGAGTYTTSISGSTTTEGVPVVAGTPSISSTSLAFKYLGTNSVISVMVLAPILEKFLSCCWVNVISSERRRICPR